jgi:hypothetical protein
MQNNITDKKYHNLSDDVYNINERSVERKKIDELWKMQCFKCKKTTKKSNLGCLFIFFSRKKVTRIIITIL